MSMAYLKELEVDNSIKIVCQKQILEELIIKQRTLKRIIARGLELKTRVRKNA